VKKEKKDQQQVQKGQQTAGQKVAAEGVLG